MNEKERILLYRISQCQCAKPVKNPADIKEKLKFYGEQVEISRLLFWALNSMYDTQSDYEEKEEAVVSLEEGYKKLYA